MKYQCKWFMAAGLFAAVTLVSVAAAAQQKNPSPLPQNVFVVNGTGQPVPTAAQGTTNVAGTVNVGNTPTVTIANTPSVNIANSPSVHISGTPTVTLAPGGTTGVVNALNGSNNAIPLAITEGAQFVVQQCQANFGGSGSAGCNFPTVASGKLLVVQEMDAEVALDTGVKLSTITFNDGITQHYFMDTFMATFQATDFYATHQVTHLYVAPGTTPACAVLSNSNGSVNGYLNCQLSGFLIDQP